MSVSMVVKRSTYRPITYDSIDLNLYNENISRIFQIFQINSVFCEDDKIKL